MNAVFGYDPSPTHQADNTYFSGYVLPRIKPTTTSTITTHSQYHQLSTTNAYNHRSSYSPYKKQTSDVHRHRRAYTSFGREENVMVDSNNDDIDNSNIGQDWSYRDTVGDARNGGYNGHSEAPPTPFRPFKDEFRTDEYYKRYIQLSGNTAYRYPEPGYPRERQGAMGGTWRHIKEVGGYGGNQVCFVDGLVRLYDHDLKRQPSPSKQLPHMRHMMGTPAYAPNRHNITSYGKTLQTEMERSAYKPWDPSTNMTSGNMTARYSYNKQQ